MDIEGIGEKQVQRFLDEDLIRDVGRSVRPPRAEQLTALDRMGETSSGNLIGEIRRLPRGAFPPGPVRARVRRASARSPPRRWPTSSGRSRSCGRRSRADRGDGRSRVRSWRSRSPRPSPRSAPADCREAPRPRASGSSSTPRRGAPRAARSKAGPVVLTGTLPEPDAGGGCGAGQEGRGEGRPIRCRRRPTTSSPATAPDRSWPRRRSSATRSSTKARPARAPRRRS